MKRWLAFSLMSLLLAFRVGAGCAEAAAVGDIVLSDGSIVCAQSLSAWDAERFPVAVIAAVYEDGSALGLGTHRSDGPLPWASEGSAGETTRFAALESWIEGAEEGRADLAGFEGLLDGSEGWQIICAEDEQGAMDAARYYPAFDFVSTYAQAHGLTGDAAVGWYLPSIAEVCAAYQNREIIDRSLHLIHSLDGAAAMDGLGTNWYWSSSQSGVRDGYAWFVHYFNGYVSDCPKSFDNLHVLAVKRY